jgi:Ala-tRNA(Pro) deacylase
MGIALTLQEYLSDEKIDYEVMTHERTSSSLRTAEASHIPGDCLAKGVVLTREGGCVMVVVPASHKVQLDVIEQMLHCPVGMASEDEVNSIFPDCEPGAIPPIAAAYGLDCIVDDSLDHVADIYLEGGDHRSLIHMRGMQFRDLLRDAPHAHVAAHG